MSYLVLARKYRPQTFSEVVGQGHVTRTLENAFAQDRVHHAFLFCGPRGVGKTTAARILGKALNCVNGPTAEPCGVCDACTSIAAGTAVDYFEMDGASNRGIDSIRDLTEAVRYQPALLRKKVYVIDEVHMLTTEAFNALLKTLEEPPPHVCFVMATTEPHKVPNTILSRCQRYDFKLVPAGVLEAHIAEVFSKEEISIAPEAAALIVRESGGSVRDAMSLCDQIISYVGQEEITEEKVAEVLGVADRALTSSLTLALAQGDAKTALSTVDAAVARGIGEVQLCRAIVQHLRDLAVAQVGASDVLGQDGARAEIEKSAKEIEPNRVKQMFERMLRASDDLGQSSQPRLVLDLALIDVATLEPLLPLGDLLNRLGDLERKLGAGGRGGGGGGGSASKQRAGRPTMPEAPSGGRKASAAPPPAEAAPAPARADAPAPSAPPSAAPARASAPSQSRDEERPPPPEPPGQSAAPAQSVAAGSGPVAAEPSPPPRAEPPPNAPPGFRMWDRVISALEERRRLSLVRLFQEAKLLEVDEQRIVVGYPAGSIDAELASERDKIEAMTAFLAEELGRPMKFEVKQLSASEISDRGQEARSLVEVADDIKREDREQRSQEAREHPMTKMVLETFGATIKEIKTNV